MAYVKKLYYEDERYPVSGRRRERSGRGETLRNYLAPTSSVCSLPPESSMRTDTVPPRDRCS